MGGSLKGGTAAGLRDKPWCKEGYFFTHPHPPYLAHPPFFPLVNSHIWYPRAIEGELNQTKISGWPSGLVEPGLSLGLHNSDQTMYNYSLAASLRRFPPFVPLPVVPIMLKTPIHNWLKLLDLSYIPGQGGALADRVASALVETLREAGHNIHATPSPHTEVILTTARAGKALGWREALMFTARRRYSLEHVPTVFTIVDVTPGQLTDWLAQIKKVLDGTGPLPPAFAGLPETALGPLLQQGRRGGAILYLGRLLQVQTKCIRILLVIGTEQPETAYLFDLVGAHPEIPFQEPGLFLQDIATRILTAASTTEITAHEVVGTEISRAEWEDRAAIREMLQASREFGQRDFFTHMVRVSDLAEIPGFSEAISSQYSEGCFATWDPGLNALLTTITGSARPVSKENITDQDLAVITGIKAEQDGALVRHVEGHPNHPPSSEAVEMIGMDTLLPRIRLSDGTEVPVIRSKLHGHRAVRLYDPELIEYVSLPESYLYYPVSCSTDAQYRAVKAAFRSSEALQNPEDPRQIVFTILPGHGSVIVEKWQPGKQAFQLIWEAMDRGALEIFDSIPQGPFGFEQRRGLFVLAPRIEPTEGSHLHAH